MYSIVYTIDARKDIALLCKHAPQALMKLRKLIAELEVHPRSGTGQCEQLKHYTEETWSRRISAEHRLVYRIYDDRVEVLVVAAYGHYR